VWQVLGSNQHRLSRRFYSPILLFEAYDVDLRLCASRRDLGRSPSAMRPWAPGSGAERSADHGRTGHGRARTSLRTATDQPTDEARKATDAADGSSYTHRPPRFFPLTWHFRMPEDYRRPPRHRTSARWSVGTPGRQFRTAISLPSVA
jgi:hypothetical protein